MIFSTQINSFGLDISDKSIKVAQLEKNKKGHELTAICQHDIPEGLISKGEILDAKKLVDHVKKTVHCCQPEIKGQHVIASLPEVKTYIKLINVKRETQNKHDREIIETKIKKILPNHVPLPINESFFDWQIIREKNNYYQILVGVAPQKIIDDFTKVIKEAGFYPMALEIEAQAILRAILPKSNYYLKKPFLLKEANFSEILKKIHLNLKQKKEEQKNNQEAKKNKPVYLVVDAGATRSGLTLWADGTIKFTTSLKTCGDNLTKKIEEQLKLEKKEAEKLKKIYGLKKNSSKTNLNKILMPELKSFCQEIETAKNFYQKNFDEKENNFEILLTGGMSNLKELDNEIAKKIKIKVHNADPLKNISTRSGVLPQKDQKQSFATAIGLALRPYLVKDY